MGVEAARACLAAVPDGVRVGQLLFATADPAYLDKTNATAIHAALDLDPAVPAFDMVGSVNSASGAMAAANFAPMPTLVVLSDVRTGVIGNTGTAHSGVVLADLLDRAEAGKVILRVVLADGAIATVVRTTEALPQWRERRPSGATVAEQIAAGNAELSYPTFL